MAHCRACGREFDPLGFQVVAPGVSEGFDRVDCAEQSRSAAGPTAASTPLGAVVDPFPPAAAPAVLAASALPAAAATKARRPLLVSANLALLAAGTAATVFLWFRVFGADPSAFELTDLSAGPAPAFERTTVPAQPSASQPGTA